MLVISQPPFIIYIVAISVSTSYGGIRAGIVAAALAFFASTYLFVPPHFSLVNERSVLPLLAFYGGAVVLNVLVTLAFVRQRGGSQQASHRPWWRDSNGKRRNGNRNPHQHHYYSMIKFFSLAIFALLIFKGFGHQGCLATVSERLPNPESSH
jgi:hypothetical protein